MSTLTIFFVCFVLISLGCLSWWINSVAITMKKYFIPKDKIEKTVLQILEDKKLETLTPISKSSSDLSKCNLYYANTHRKLGNRLKKGDIITKYGYKFRLLSDPTVQDVTAYETVQGRRVNVRITALAYKVCNGGSNQSKDVTVHWTKVFNNPGPFKRFYVTDADVCDNVEFF